ncbi:hypothetical protein DPMN_121199 [Dreissena polymorpha]|uniref:Uncharacterized protein n=1 Tax=Dreissena polymorpha TaxID=45954 RepID=A0A9D4GPP0_DREPO|nr:hypothetical protein DPMN_121199 [Dreissena polymorpha]
MIVRDVFEIGEAFELFMRLALNCDRYDVGCAGFERLALSPLDSEAQSSSVVCNTGIRFAFVKGFNYPVYMAIRNSKGESKQPCFTTVLILRRHRLAVWCGRFRRSSFSKTS